MTQSKKVSPAAKKRPAAKRPLGVTKRSIQGRGIFDPGQLVAEIFKRRSAKGYTPRQLSVELGMAPNTIGDMEAKGSDMRVGTLIAIARGLGVKASKLLATVGE